jgi:chromate transporter
VNWETLGPTLQLAGHLFVLSFFAVGGAHAVLPDVYRFMVTEHGWVTGAQFGTLVALSQAAPGPNVLVLSLLGYQVSGVLGATLALVAFCIPSGVICYTIARWDRAGGDTPWKRIVKAGLAPLTVGVVIASGTILAQSAGATGAIPILLAGATALLSASKSWHPLWYIAVGALVTVFL